MAVMPARHEDTQDHGKQQLFHNLSSFPAWAPLCLDISGPSLLIQHRARAFRREQRDLIHREDFENNSNGLEY